MKNKELLLVLFVFPFLFFNCSKKEGNDEMQVEKVPLTNLTQNAIPKATLPPSTKMKWVVIGSSERMECVNEAGYCVKPTTPVPPIKEGELPEMCKKWTDVFSVYSGTELYKFFEEHPELLPIENNYRDDLLIMFEKDLIKIVPAYSNISSPKPEQIQHFCIILKDQILEEDYSNVIYMLQYTLK